MASSRRVRLRVSAAADIEAALRAYVDEAGVDVAGRFVDAVEQAMRHVARSPHSGSLSFAHEVGIPELRVWPLARFPYLVFYRVRPHHVDVLRVLHSRRDVPASFHVVGDSSDTP